MAWGITRYEVLYDPTQDQGVPNPVAGQQATGASASLTASQTGLAVAAAATTNSTNFNAGSPMAAVKAAVLLTGSAGTATIQVLLQMSSSSSFASDVVTVDEKFINANVAGTIYSLVLFGGVLDTKRQFIRVSFVTGAGTSATADIGILAI